MKIYSLFIYVNIESELYTNHNCLHTLSLSPQQLNRFRQSVRQLLFDSNSSYNTHSYTNNHTSNHTHHQTTASRIPTYTQTPPTSTYHTTEGGTSHHFDVRIPPGMASEGYVYPKQFAPRTTTNKRHLHYNTTANNYKQPPTPPVSD